MAAWAGLAPAARPAALPVHAASLLLRLLRLLLARLLWLLLGALARRLLVALALLLALRALLLLLLALAVLLAARRALALLSAAPALAAALLLGAIAARRQAGEPRWQPGRLPLLLLLLLLLLLGLGCGFPCCWAWGVAVRHFTGRWAHTYRCRSRRLCRSKPGLRWGGGLPCGRWCRRASR